jgi:hypothetical protein
MMYLFIDYSTHPFVLCFKTTHMMSWIVLRAREIRFGTLHLEEDLNKCMWHISWFCYSVLSMFRLRVLRLSFNEMSCNNSNTKD